MQRRTDAGTEPPFPEKLLDIVIWQEQAFDAWSAAAIAAIQPDSTRTCEKVRRVALLHRGAFGSIKISIF